MALDFSKINKEKIQKLIDINPDSRRYFFTKADEEWLDWLWGNGFLNVIKEKGLNLDSYGYVTPELDYLVKVAAKAPQKVVDIMLEVSITTETYNPEVADRFLWIVSELPLEQMVKMIPKIKEENWPKLMRRYGHSAYLYQKMIEKIMKEKNYATLILLAEPILAIRTKEEIKETANGFGTDNPFYFEDIDQTNIFESLVDVSDEYAEKALTLVISTMKQIVLLGEKIEGDPFDIGDLFYLFDVDFFSLSVGDKNNFSYRDSVRNLAATIKELIERLIGKKCDEETEIDRIYKTYIESLPFSRAMWRLRLFVVSLCPEVFKEKIHEFFFKIFDKDKWSHFTSGAEYEWLLKKAFSTLNEEDRQKYINQVFKFFGDDSKESFYKSHGYDLLSSIEKYLTEDQKKEAEKVFTRRPNPDYIPEPSIKESHAGVIVPQSPFTEEDFGIPVDEIAKKLASEWSPSEIRKQYGDGDFFRPFNAEGVSEILQKNIANRLQEYVDDSILFFNKDTLHAQYTYAFLRGVYDVISKESFKKDSANLEKLLPLFKAIMDEGKKGTLLPKKEKDLSDDGWLANWAWIHNTMADVLKDLIGENKDVPLIDFPKDRNLILEIISYLLTYPSPTVEDNIREHGGDPFTTAINSVRGRAFQALAIFAYQDGLLFPKDAEIKINQDVIDIYDALLAKEDTYAIMFMFGHYLPSFYYRHKKWIQSKLPEIFPFESKKLLYMASWEGYVSSPLYKELFVELEPYYEYAINEIPVKEERRYFKDVDEGIGTHVALAYMHFDVTVDSDIFKKFWSSKNVEQHTEFVSFIGRYAISRDNGATFREENKISIEKIKVVWDWILENCNEPETFAGFGFLINDQSKAFELKWLAEHAYKTLQKSEGKLQWEYGMMRSLSQFAKEAPEDTLKILEAYLVGPRVTDESFRVSIYIETEIFEVLKILYENPNIKEGTYILINKLIPLGNGRFWKLKEITAAQK